MGDFKGSQQRDHLSLSHASPPPDQLRYGAGTKGDCHNNCCFFRPPSKNIPDAPPNPLWYESSDCNDDSKAENKPIILTGENGEERTVCIQNNEGEFSPVSGATMAVPEDAASSLLRKIEYNSIHTSWHNYN